MSTDSIILGVRDLSKSFGGVTAISGWCLDLARGEILGMIGPNGAGKTTAFNLLTGVLAPSSGRIVLHGRDLTGSGPEAFARGGISRTFQNIRLFQDLSVWENVAVGLHMHEGPGWIATVIGLPSARRRERTIREKAEALLETVGLAGMGSRRAGDLPYGLQRKVEIARALATGPSVLLLDEPAAGMNPSETAHLTETLRAIARAARSHAGEPVTMVVVEHDMRLVMSLCTRVQVLDRGVLLADGAPAEIQRDERVIAAYLGSGRKKDRADAVA
ncbi:ABC transporter ATP-binding protein [Salinarimonas rosea]|uniref:ABC transporter ATP-binding protein n=1 Tax=Salinarimonas rosea TaxID=552063 RepID=UPI0004206166|nr:ABC transporter ATP-binding protein [Salinarimonas rosea]